MNSHNEIEMVEDALHPAHDDEGGAMNKKHLIAVPLAVVGSMGMTSAAQAAGDFGGDGPTELAIGVEIDTNVANEVPRFEIVGDGRADVITGAGPTPG